jgi:hypothetical protein
MVSVQPRPMRMVNSELAQLSFLEPRHCRKPTASKVKKITCVQMHNTHFDGLLHEENQLCWNLSELKNTPTRLDYISLYGC